MVSRSLHIIAGNGSGLAFIYRDKHTVEIKENGQKKSFEYLVCTIRIQGILVTLAIIYHPPYSTTNRVTIPMFIDEFTQFLPGILVKYRNLITLGDFNLHLDTTDPDAAIFTDIMDAMGLTPHVTVATHVAGHTLDQMYTVLNSQVEVVQCSQGPLLSDHHVIIGHLAPPKNATTIHTIKCRQIKLIDLEAFKNDISTEDIPLTDNDTVISALDS